MFGRKKQSISKKYILILILLLIIFSFTLKEDRKLSKAESLLKDGLTYSEKIITYPFNYVKENIKEYKKLKDVNKNNNILETSIDRIDSIEAENIELRRQLETLKEELNINYTLSDYEYLNANLPHLASKPKNR